MKKAWKLFVLPSAVDFWTTMYIDKYKKSTQSVNFKFLIPIYMKVSSFQQREQERKAHYLLCQIQITICAVFFVLVGQK